MAPPYHYHGTSQQEQAAPAAEDESGAGSGGQEAESRSLRIRELFPWMDEDYLRSCFTRSPERSRVWMVCDYCFCSYRTIFVHKGHILILTRTIADFLLVNLIHV
ncbi:hypothetical protein VPH35_029035 [Triticum aestivum]